MEIVLATKNKDKIREISQILGRGRFETCPYTFSSLLDYPEIPEIIEDGKTLVENALKKARTVTASTGKIALADDSGLEIDALQGRPGVYSSRFARGVKFNAPTYAQNVKKVLKLLKGIPPAKRKARFRCVVAIAKPARGDPTGRPYYVAEGSCLGHITEEPKGKGGFGYDPIFVPKGFKKTFAEFSPLTKNRISHRAKALRKAKKILQKMQ
ncbi:MAG: RdgB/HAM1 family non-canonical purine NTP pyrophosphatase [Candidatus Edwardsbacteria bacterium]